WPRDWSSDVCSSDLSNARRRRTNEAGNHGHDTRLDHLRKFLAALSGFVEIDEEEFGVFTGDDNLPRIDRFRFQSQFPQVPAKDRNNEPLSKRTDQIARTGAHLAQERNPCEHLLNLFPNAATRVLQFVNGVAVLESFVYGPILPASDFAKFVIS